MKGRVYQKSSWPHRVKTFAEALEKCSFYSALPGLAIVFIIAAADSALVTALVNDLINPVMGLVLPSGNLASLNATVTSPLPSQKPTVFLYGDFVSKVINFIIIALVVFHVQAAQEIRSGQGLDESRALLVFPI